MELRDRSMPRQGVAECAAIAAVTTVRRGTAAIFRPRLSGARASHHTHRVDDGGSWKLRAFHAF